MSILSVTINILIVNKINKRIHFDESMCFIYNSLKSLSIGINKSVKPYRTHKATVATSHDENINTNQTVIETSY